MFWTWIDPSLVLKNQRVVFIRSANRTSILEQRHTENSPSVSIWSFILTRNHQSQPDLGPVGSDRNWTFTQNFICTGSVLNKVLHVF